MAGLNRAYTGWEIRAMSKAPPPGLPVGLSTRDNHFRLAFHETCAAEVRRPRAFIVWLTGDATNAQMIHTLAAATNRPMSAISIASGKRDLSHLSARGLKAHPRPVEIVHRSAVREPAVFVPDDHLPCFPAVEVSLIGPNEAMLAAADKPWGPQYLAVTAETALQAAQAVLGSQPDTIILTQWTHQAWRTLACEELFIFTRQATACIFRKYPMQVIWPAVTPGSGRTSEPGQVFVVEPQSELRAFADDVVSINTPPITILFREAKVFDFSARVPTAITGEQICQLLNLIGQFHASEICMVFEDETQQGDVLSNVEMYAMSGRKGLTIRQGYLLPPLSFSGGQDATQHHVTSDFVSGEGHTNMSRMSSGELTGLASSLTNYANMQDLIIDDEHQSIARDLQELAGVTLGHGLWY